MDRSDTVIPVYDFTSTASIFLWISVNAGRHISSVSGTIAGSMRVFHHQYLGKSVPLALDNAKVLIVPSGEWADVIA